MNTKIHTLVTISSYKFYVFYYKYYFKIVIKNKITARKNIPDFQTCQLNRFF